MKSSNLFIGNIVSFVDTEYFIKLKIIKENVLLYKYENFYIDVTNQEYVNEYVNYILKNDNSKILSSLPVYEIFVDENSLIPYSVKKLTR